MEKQEQSKKMGQVIAKAWADEAFKQRLLDDACAVLKEEGIEVPPGLEVRAVENTDRVYYLVLPSHPANMELSDDELEEVVGGYYHVVFKCPKGTIGCLDTSGEFRNDSFGCERDNVQYNVVG